MRRMSEIERISAVIDAVLEPGRFYIAPGLELDWTRSQAEDTLWEIFRGRLLDPAQTRTRKVFSSWHIHLVENGERSSEPLLSLKWDDSTREIHVVRGLLCYVWEAYDSGGNVILSREIRKWVRELVGTVNLDHVPPEKLHDELSQRVFQAFVGASRLPLNSVEAPLPGFSLGRLAYFDWPDASAFIMRMLQGARSAERGAVGAAGNSAPGAPSAALSAAKLLEFLLRASETEEIAKVARRFADLWLRGPRPDVPARFRTLFNEVSLSPYTCFVENALAFLRAMAEQGHMMLEQRIDFLSHLLRQLGRHLTAYDLITFHHRGANYPDALLLGAVLKDYVGLIEENADLFAADSTTGRLRRRALRQACLLRRFYEGHLVPDAPTSPGENARVLPAPHVRVPEEQLLQPLKRRRQLYAGEPTLGLLGPHSRAILQASLCDLSHPAELRELGMAIFIDRPLGMSKAPGEPDDTPLLSHEAFSRSIAERRLRELVHFDSELPLEMLRARLRELPVTGFPALDVAVPDRPVVSLADARRVAEDFVFLRTLPGSVRQFFETLDRSTLPRFDLEGVTREPVLLIVTPAAPPGVVAVYDATMRCIMQIKPAGGSAQTPGPPPQRKAGRQPPSS
jgi:hypothetical protein